MGLRLHVVVRKPSGEFKFFMKNIIQNAQNVYVFHITTITD
jgi:hypothetical protein